MIRLMKPSSPGFSTFTSKFGGKTAYLARLSCYSFSSMSMTFHTMEANNASTRKSSGTDRTDRAQAGTAPRWLDHWRTCARVSRRSEHDFPRSGRYSVHGDRLEQKGEALPPRLSLSPPCQALDQRTAGDLPGGAPALTSQR